MWFLKLIFGLAHIETLVDRPLLIFIFYLLLFAFVAGVVWGLGHLLNWLTF